MGYYKNFIKAYYMKVKLLKQLRANLSIEKRNSRYRLNASAKYQDKYYIILSNNYVGHLHETQEEALNCYYEAMLDIAKCIYGEPSKERIL